MALKEAILETLSCMLSENSEIRKVAEDRNKALEVAEDYPLYLLEILLTSDEALEERQIAGILFTHFIESYWEFSLDIMSNINIQEVTREKIREILPMGLADPVHKIRAATAHIMVIMADFDYPEKWPELKAVLALKAKTIDLNYLEGLLLFLNECGDVIDAIAFADIGSKFYKELFEICHNNMYPVELQALTVNTMAKIFTVDYYARENKLCETFTTTVRDFIMLFGMHLTKPYNSKNDFHLKTQILKAFMVLLYTVEQIVIHPIVSLIPAVFDLLENCSDDYRKMLINIELYPELSPLEDDINTVFTYDLLTSNIFSFISTIIDFNPEHLHHLLPEIVHAIFLFMAITNKIESDWRRDEVNIYTDDIEEEIMPNSMRTTLQKLLKDMAKKFDKEQLAAAIKFAVEKHSSAANQLKPQSEIYWWRIHESLMYALGSISDIILESHMPLMNLNNYLAQWTQFMDVCKHDLVLGRILWVGGKFSPLLDGPHMDKHLKTVVHYMKSDQPILRVLSLKAFHYHCEFLHVSPTLKVFEDNLDNILDCLVKIQSKSPGIVSLVIDSTKKIVEINKRLSIPQTTKLVPYIMSLFFHNMNNPDMVSNSFIMNKFRDLIGEFMKYSDCSLTMYQQFLPMIVSVIQHPSCYNIDVRKITIDILTCFVVSSPRPLSDMLIDRGYKELVRYLTILDDKTALKCTANCLRAFLEHSPEQVILSGDHSRLRGTGIVMNIAAFFLNPAKRTLACRDISMLVIACMKALGNYIEENHIKIILKDALTTTHNLFIKNIPNDITIIFAYTFYQFYDNTVTLLSIIPGPDGGSALEFILKRWMDTYSNYTATYDKNLISVAFAQVVERAILDNDIRVSQVTILSDRKPIPIPIKMLDVLVNILIAEGNKLRNVKVETNEDDSNSDTPTTSLLDEIESKDPLSMLNIGEYLFNFLKKLSHHPGFPDILMHLSTAQNVELNNLGVFDDMRRCMQ